MDIDPYTDAKYVQRQGWTTQIASQVVEVVDCPNWKNMRDSAAVQCGKVIEFKWLVIFCAGEKEEETCERIVHVNYKIKQVTYLLDVMKSVYDIVFVSQSICSFL